MSILEKIVNHKLQEIESAKQRLPLQELESQLSDSPPLRDFVTPLKSPDRMGLIAEVKKASPSKGIIRADFDPLAIASSYQAAGADCISVLTDETFFQGKLEYLRAIRQTTSIPLLRKDFILDEYQVVEARVAGADAVLLIAECLDPIRLRDLHQAICDLGMTPLVELYEADNVQSVLDCQPKLVGVNNRNLRTFEVDLQHTLRIKAQLPPSITVVSESGIENSQQVSFLQDHGIAAILVGESLMRKPDVAAAVQSLMS